jgi:hypothetical protein
MLSCVNRARFSCVPIAPIAELTCTIPTTVSAARHATRDVCVPGPICTGLILAAVLTDTGRNQPYEQSNAPIAIH